MSKDALWVLEWNHETNNIHVQPADWMTARNFGHFYGNTKPANGYVVIFIGSRAEVEAEANRIRPELAKREEAMV